jgi:4-hydroxy-tetrahydrodipicolinate synthase
LPSSFWPNSEDEIFEYTKAFCEATDLAVMIFPIPLWQFERVHPAGMQVSLIRRILDALPNVVAIKSEQGFPGIGGLLEMYHHFRDEVVISCPIEADIIPLLSVMDIQYSGTSNTNWMSDWFPTVLRQAQNGQWGQAMESWWQVSPARAAGGQAQASAPTISVLNRTTWKYQEWLAGYNGGALRAPAMRVPNGVMKSLRASLVASGRPVTDSPDSEFVRGRIVP